MAQQTDTASLSPAWQALRQLEEKCRDTSIRQLFSADPQRAQNWRRKAAGIEVDLSRNNIDKDILDALIDLAKEQGLEKKRAQLLNGEVVNHSENKSAQHIAWRRTLDSNTAEEIISCRKKMEKFSTAVRDGSWRGADGQRISDVVNIGIGGSDIGPRMVCTALETLDKSPIKMHFVANIDPLDIEQALRPLQPKKTLIIISSKSFDTTESLQNADSARRWLQQEIKEQLLGRHVVAITANREKAISFGVERDNIFPLTETVGGRYSLWAATGLPIAIAAGYDQFEKLLAGAQTMDQHFSEAELNDNLPCLLALLEIWYTNINQANSIAVLPYSHLLRNFPAHIQQLAMESNGKGVDVLGSQLKQRSCPTIWGAEGSPSQHSFHQLLHQGTELIPIDFILPLSSQCEAHHKQAQLVAHCLAQSKALLDGQSIEVAEKSLLDQGLNAQQANELAKHTAMPGNRPSTIIAMETLDAASLGALIALYEHKVFAISTLLNINAFDQWGVELGKKMSTPIHSMLRREKDFETNNEVDSVTAWWIRRYRQIKKK